MSLAPLGCTKRVRCLASSIYQLGRKLAQLELASRLESNDYITSTHRGHGHCLAKGAAPGAMMAELAGKVTGYSKGRGGSMHIADVAVGVLGANGIVGQSAPLACGAAYTAQVKKTKQLALAFFGRVRLALVQFMKL